MNPFLRFVALWAIFWASYAVIGVAAVLVMILTGVEDNEPILTAVMFACLGAAGMVVHHMRRCSPRHTGAGLDPSAHPALVDACRG